MAKYTIEISELARRGFRFALYDYPIFDEAYRAHLNEAILNAYWYDEIGMETPDRFNHYLNARMQQIMPRYNMLYRSQLLEYDPLTSVEFRSTNDAEDIGESKNLMNEGGVNKRTSSDWGSTYSTAGTTADSTGEQHGEGTNISVTTGESTEDTEGKNSYKDTEHIETNQTVTTDMDTTNHTQTDGTVTDVGRTTSNTTFSDIPQSGFHTTVTQNPDGSVTTETTGYATTTTNVQGTNNNTQTTHSVSDGTVKNEGTVKTEGESDRTLNHTGEDEKHTTGSTKGTGDTSTTDDQTTASHEETSSTSRGNTENRNNATDVQSRTTSTTQAQRNKRTNITVNQGRNQSAASLILEWRETFLNIDSMVIADLSDLFMGVY